MKYITQINIVLILSASDTMCCAFHWTAGIRELHVYWLCASV